VIGVATLVTREGQNLGFAIAVEEVKRALNAPRVAIEPPSEPPLLDPAPAPSVPTAGPSPTRKNVVWSDGRPLIHPEYSVRAYVTNITIHDTLTLRSGPGTRFESVKEIPRNGTDLIAFDQDRVWDGDTWWYPTEWQGFRGYVGRSHLSNH
jgi:hypothetical protein